MTPPFFMPHGIYCHRRKFIDTELKVRMVLMGLYLLAKCYKVWGAKKKIIAFPVLTSIINNGFSLLELLSGRTMNFMAAIKTGPSPLARSTAEIFLAVNFFINLVIPLMIGGSGRIWWIGHQVAKFLPTGNVNLTRRTIAVCLESGIMYPLALIPVLIFICQKSTDFDAYAFVYIPILVQIVGIAPTFIILYTYVLLFISYSHFFFNPEEVVEFIHLRNCYRLLHERPSSGGLVWTLTEFKGLISNGCAYG
ncbi:hypothetical protein K435DRAFT_797978 [Dendrothele bispora CBS 962.96]|uniref:Uncharacterized protein n=1 Tax=Dendrothele bispora (strain CBS 962.96) TaxID=1314807 RepID=A0A4S8M1R7_DENBC|nr:hypothetical protein K435DRAFT_797978 [Dendrothele bispora CBS 962.96]